MSTEYVHWKRDPAFATSAMFDAAICLFETLNTPFAFSYLPHEVEWGTPVTLTHLEQNTIPDVFWMTMLSAPTVEEIGRDRFDDLPVDRMRQLDNGGAAFAAVDDAFKGYTPEVKQRVRDHLEIGGGRKT